MSVKQSIYIDAPVEKVFDFWKDPRNQALVMPKGAFPLTDMKMTEEGVGTYFGWTMRLFGLPVEGFDVFTEFVPNERITDRSSFGLAGTWTYTFEQEGPGTRFTMWRHPVSWWALRLVDPLFDRYRASVTQLMLRKLKAEMEKPTAAAAAAAPAASGRPSAR